MGEGIYPPILLFSCSLQARNQGGGALGAGQLTLQEP
jgi:hypothetical protein